MGYEIGRGQMEGSEFFEVYYHETKNDSPNWVKARSRAGIVMMLRKLKLKLQTAYPDCAPLRQQIHKVDMAVSLITRMKPTDD